MSKLIIKMIGLRGRLLLLASLAGTPLTLGCSDGRKPVFPVRGQVTVGGQPARHAQVTFHPVGDASPEAVHPVGQVDDQGYFDLTSYTKGDGAPEGDYKVTVQWILATKSANPTTEEYVTKNHLPDRYAKAETSGLQATVSKGANELPAFELQPR